MPIFQLVTHHGSLFEDAVTEIDKLGTDAILRFSPQGLSLTVEDGGKLVAGLRIFAGDGGCHFCCTESRSARIDLNELGNTLFVANSGESALSISIKIDPIGEDPAIEEEDSTPATLNISWFDPPNSPGEDPKQETGTGDYKISLRLSKVDNQNPLLKYDESMYEAAAGLIPAGIDRLDKELQNRIEQDGRTEDEIRVVISLTPAMLGFFTCQNGWKYGAEAEEEGDVLVEACIREEGVANDMRFGLYTAEMLRRHINSAKVVNAWRLWFHIQNGLPNLLTCPLSTGNGKLGTLYFFSADTQLHLPDPFSPLIFSFLRSL